MNEERDIVHLFEELTAGNKTAIQSDLMRVLPLATNILYNLVGVLKKIGHKKTLRILRQLSNAPIENIDIDRFLQRLEDERIATKSNTDPGVSGG